MTAVAFIALGLGIMLLWSAIKNEDPRDVVRRTFQIGG